MEDLSEADFYENGEVLEAMGYKGEAFQSMIRAIVSDEYMQVKPLKGNHSAKELLPTSNKITEFLSNIESVCLTEEQTNYVDNKCNNNGLIGCKYMTTQRG